MSFGGICEQYNNIKKTFLKKGNILIRKRKCILKNRNKAATFYVTKILMLKNKIVFYKYQCLYTYRVDSISQRTKSY